MKITILTSSLGSGGAERVASTLANAWVGRGDQVTIVPTFSGGTLPFYELVEGIQLKSLADLVGGAVGFRSYPRRLYALRKLIVEGRPNVVIAFLPNVNVAAIVATVGAGIPVVICERSDPSVQPYKGYWKQACQLTYRFADMLTVQTEAVANKSQRIFPGLKRVRAVPNPLPSDVLTYQRESRPGRKILLSMGRLSQEKQVDKIIRAFCNAAAGRRLDWDLHIYGDGPMKGDLEQAISKSGLQHRIYLKGRTTEPWKVMAEADAFVMASSYEGFPNTLLEAMGVGLPSVVFDCPSGPREISEDGQTALLVPLNDEHALMSALLRVMSDEVFAKTLGIQARESVRLKFSLASVLTSWDRIFAEVGA